MHRIKFVHWGKIDFSLAQTQQLNALKSIAENQAPEQIIFCTHPPIVTLGRRAKVHAAPTTPPPAIPIAEAQRGGQATYHGPEQLIVYLLIRLKQQRSLMPACDIHAYLNNLERSIQVGLKQVGFSSTAHQRGLWVEGKKVVSIGIGVRRWVTYHGAAINIQPAQHGFKNISPCGLNPTQMGSLMELSTRPLDPHKLRQKLIHALEQSFTKSFTKHN